jgi:hypothetical protein
MGFYCESSSPLFIAIPIGNDRVFIAPLNRNEKNHLLCDLCVLERSGREMPPQIAV